MRYPIRFPAFMRDGPSPPPPCSGRVDLPDGAWRLEFRWSPTHRGEAGLWLLDVFEERGDLAAAAVPFVVHPSLLSPYRSRGRVPAGDLVVASSLRPARDPGARDLGGAASAAFVYP